MIEIRSSGLPIFLNEETCQLEFRDGLTCAGSSARNAGQLRGLLLNENGIDENEPCYQAYRDIVFESDRAVFQKRDFRYDITLIRPGVVGGECKKTSGHYHGYIPGQPYTYPEVYEVLMGSAIYILQKVLNFDRDEEPVIGDLKAVYVKAGQAIIIPPFYGHCSINAGAGPLIFSNLAVVSCQLFYEPIQRKHGLSVYAAREGDSVTLVRNPNYRSVPEITRVTPRENHELGICFGKPVYSTFLQSPEKFDFLLNPAKHENAMADMLCQVL